MTKPPVMPELPEPEAYIFQHEETGNTMFVCRQQVEWGFERNNPRLQKVGEAFTADQMRAYALAALQSAQPAAASDDDILTAGHRTAWRYKHSSDPAHSSTYTFNRACLLQFARAILALRPQAVPMTDARGMSVAFHLTRDQLPRLVNRTSSYGGIWSSRMCVVIGKDGHFSMSQLKVSDATKARIDAGEPIPRDRFNIDFKGGSSDFYDKTCFAWAYLDDVVSILNGITKRADGGEG